MAFLSQKEVALLLDTLEGDYWRVALLCLSTGARWSEACKLRGEQIVHNRVTFLETKMAGREQCQFRRQFVRRSKPEKQVACLR